MEQSERETLENQKLESALSLKTTSFQKIKDLDKDYEGLNDSNNRRKFQTLTEHHLLLAESSYFQNTFPPRILYAIRDSENLNQYLTPKQKSRIARIFDEEKIKIQEYAKENWDHLSNTKILQICAFFEVLKKEKSGKNDQELFSKLAKKLYEKSVSLLYLRNKKQKNWDDVSKQDKLLFLEMYRLHPKQEKWNIVFGDKKNVIEIVEEFSKEVSKEILDGDNDKDTILFWETIEVLQKKYLAIEDLEGVVQRRITRNNSAQLIAWAENQRTVLPVQFKFLQELVENKDNFGKLEYQLADTEETKKIEKKEDEYLKLKKHKENLDGISEKEQWEYLLENEKNISKLTDIEDLKKIAKTIKRLEEAKKKFIKDNLSEELKKLTEDVQKEIKKELDDFEDIPFSFKEDDIDTKIAEILKDNEEEDSMFLDILKDFKQNEQNLKNSKEEFSEKLKEKDIEQEIKDKEKGLEELCETGLYGALEDPKGQAEKSLEGIKISMRDRAQNKRLLANDLLILFANEQNPEVLAEILVKKFNKNGEERDLASRETEALGKLRKIKEVRDRVLNGILKPNASTEELLAGFDRTAIHKKLSETENKRDFKEVFDSDPELQNVSEIITGFILSYKDKIDRALQGNSEEDKNDFWQRFNTKNRFHATINRGGGQGFTEAQNKYYEQKKGNDVLVGKEGAEIEKFLQEKGFSESKKKEFLVLFEENKIHFLNGHLHSKDGKEIWVAGNDAIATLQLQTAPISEEVGDTLSTLGLEITQIQRRLQEIAGIKDPLYRKAEFEKIQGRITNFCGEFDDETAHIFAATDEMQAIFMSVLGDNYNQGFADYFYKLKKSWEKIDNCVTRLKALTTFEDLDGFEPVFSTIATSLEDFKFLFDSKNGFWANEFENNKVVFDKQNETIRKLDERELWDEEGNEQYEKAEKKFEEERKKYNKEYKRFNDVISQTVDAISTDLNKYNDNDFQLKYKFPKELGRKMVSEIASSNSQFDEFWKEFNNGDGFWKRFKEKWDKNDPSSRLEALDEISYWEDIGDHIKAMADNAEQNDAFIKERKKLNNEYNLNKATSLNVEFFSLYNIYAIIKQTIEAKDRIWKQRTDVITNKIGKNIFGNSSIGKEFDRNLQTAENARMNEFKTAYENNTPTYRLWELLKNSNDKYEIEAIINILNTRGVLRWDDPILFSALNRLGGKIVYNEKDSMIDIRRQIRDACSRIWSEETFDQWNTSYESNLKSKKEKFRTEFEEQPSSDSLREMLKLWNSGNDDLEDIDPVQYEAYLEFAIKDGKMGLKDKIYYLIMGVTTKNPKNGKTLLSKETFKRFGQGEFFVAIPQMIFFDPTEHSLKKNGIPYSTEEGEAVGAKDRNWNQDDYECWRKMIDEGDGNFQHGSKTDYFITRVIEQAIDVKKRFGRLTGASEDMDHDDAPGRFAGLTVAMVKDWGINKSDGPNNISPDCWKGFLAGANQWFRHYYEFIKDGDAGKLNDRYPNWPAKKELLLKEVAEKMRVALALSQLLKKNFFDKEKQSMALLDKDWIGTEDDKMYGLGAKRDSDKIETAVEVLWNENGLNKTTDGTKSLSKDDKEKGIEGPLYYREIFDRSKMGSGKPEIMKDINAKNQTILTDNEFFKDYFVKDLGNVEKVLEQFYSKGWKDTDGVRTSGIPMF
jgi:hypothetical protein